jgi:hypothetical protein
MTPHLTTELFVSAAAALTAGRLLRLRLAARFPALMVWLAFFSLSSCIAAVVPQELPVYLRLYVMVVPLNSLFAILAVRELFELIFGNYPGIRTVGRWAMYGAVCLAVAGTLTTTKLFWSQTATGRALSGVYYLQLGQRSVVFALAVIIITLLFSISRYPLHLDWNVYVSGGFFGAVFLSQAARSLMDSLGPRLHNDYVDWTTNLFVAAFLFAWAGRLRHETARAVPDARLSSAAEDHLLGQLASLNHVLTRVAQR